MRHTARMLAAMAAAAAVFALTGSIASRAGTMEFMDRWYAALMLPDRDALAAMLADDAEITLEDLDLTQTKDEFITSMDEWEDSVKGSSERHRLDSEVDGSVTMLVCYTFPDNALLMRETFVIDGELITESVQTTVNDENCDEF